MQKKKTTPFLILQCGILKTTVVPATSLGAQSVKNPPAMHGRPGCDLWVRKIPWRRAWLPTPVFLLGESNRQSNLSGYDPWGGKESDTTEQPSRPTLAPLLSCSLLDTLGLI